MPDLQSELSTKLSSLSFDDAGQALSQANSSQEPRSVSQQMFEFIKANPGSSISKIAKQFSSAQHISTRLSQLHKTGVLKRTMTPNGYAYSVACARTLASDTREQPKSHPLLLRWTCKLL